jgi:hypothetical protein
MVLLLLLLLLLLLCEKVIIKRIKVLVTPASGSPEVDQGLTKKVLEYESSIECSQATTVSQGCDENNQERINQLPTV